MATKKPEPKAVQKKNSKAGVNFRDEDFVSPDIVQKYKDKFYQLNSRDTSRFTSEALDWFRSRVSKDLHPNRNKLLDTNIYSRAMGNQGRQLIGKLYFYKYKAENPGWKDENVYDAYPMVFFFNAVKKGDHIYLYGLNIHYLTPKERQLLLFELLKTKSSEKIRPQTRLKITWQIIKAVVQSKLYERAVHVYRVDRFQSRLVEVPAIDWSIAVFLKLENWIHLNNDGLSQSDYRKKIQGHARTHAKRNKI